MWHNVSSKIRSVIDIEITRYKIPISATISFAIIFSALSYAILSFNGFDLPIFWALILFFFINIFNDIALKKIEQINIRFYINLIRFLLNSVHFYITMLYFNSPVFYWVLSFIIILGISYSFEKIITRAFLILFFLSLFILAHYQLNIAGSVLTERIIILFFPAVMFTLTVYNLQQSQKKTESSMKIKKDFLANISHEIRTPLNGVIGMTNLLLNTNLNEVQHGFSENIKQSGENLLSIVNDILDFSKIDSDLLPLEVMSFNLYSVIEQVADLQAYAAQEKEIELVVKIDADIPQFIMADPGRIRQILTNLVGNAIKFSDSGTILIRIEKQIQYIKISVEDEGIGLPKGNIDYLFNAFTQEDNSSTRHYTGTGLGLSISKKLVELMGGEIKVENLKTKGARFSFTLPLTIDENVEQLILPPSDLSDVKVLIVDDNKINCQVLHELVTNWKMRNGQFKSGEAAYRALKEAHKKKDPYQIAILDYQMPGMDGEELGAMIKKDSDLKDTILIMLTSVGSRGDAKRFLEKGFVGYLVKPVHHSHLMDILMAAWSDRDEKQNTGLLTKYLFKEKRISYKSDPEIKAAFKGKHILLVEDNKVNQQIASLMLGSLGLQVDTVANGKEAVELGDKIKYDTILMDLQMPEMDGFEATRIIRERSKKNIDTPIIALTAHAMKADQDKCLKVGMNNFISKPLNIEKLKDVLNVCLV